jgi:hypothetical protein
MSPAMGLIDLQWEISFGGGRMWMPWWEIIATLITVVFLEQQICLYINYRGIL